MEEIILLTCVTLIFLWAIGVTVWLCRQVYRIESLLRQRYADVSHFYQSDVVEFLKQLYSPDLAWFFFSTVLRGGGEQSLLVRQYDPYRDDWRLRFRTK